MNNYAATSAGIGEALTRSASALDLAGNSIQETAGMITGIIEVTQDPEQAGSTLKILSLRLRGMKGQLEELGEETDENVENISKMQGQILNLTNGKVNIFDGSEFRSTYEIMNDIAEVWDDLNSTAQADLLETIAGKHRANSVAALLSNWENVEAAVKSASEAEGSAARENQKYVDSIQGRLDKMTTSWQSFANTFMSSDFLKGGISFLTSLIEGFEKLIDTVGTFPTLMGTIAAGFSFKNTGFFSVLNKDVAGAQKQLSLLGKSLSDIKRDFSSGQNIFTSLFSKSITKSDVGYITEYFKQVKSGVPVGQAYANTLSHASVAGKKMAVNIKKGAVSMGSLKTATIGGKLALFGLEAAATAANIALTMGLSLAIQGIVNLVSKWINAEEDLAEKVDEITSKYKEQHDSLIKLKGDYDTSNESSMISKYEKLSKGVDGLGRNVSLTADEYSEYQSIVNTIAEQIPTLVSGYDEQGNALLSCKGNVEQLAEAYEKLIHAQNQEILTQSADIEKDFDNTVKDNDSQGFWRQVATNAGFGAFGDYDMTSNAASVLSKLLNAEANGDDVDKIIRQITSDEYLFGEINTALKNANIDTGFLGVNLSDKLKEALENEPDKIKGIVDNFYGELDIEQMKSLAQATLSEAFDVSSEISGMDYDNIGETLQNVAKQVVNSLDYDFYSALRNRGESVEDWVKNMLDQLNSISESDGKEIEAAFDLQTKFNGGEISYGEYVDGLQNTGELIDGLGLEKEVESQLKLSIGLNEDGLVEEYEALNNRLVKITTKDLRDLGHFSGASDAFRMAKEDVQEFLDSLSAEEISVLTEIVPEIDAGSTIEEIKALIDKEMMLQGLTFDLNLEVEATGIEALNTALAESVTGSGLSSDSITALKGRYADLEAQGYDLSSMFEETSHGIHLNRQEFNKLEKAYSSQKLTEVDGQLKEMQSAYDKLGEDIRNCTDPVEKSKLFSERQLLAQRINEAATLASQYEGLTSAYNDWLAAEEAGSERDMYENMIEGFETIGDEISRGWLDDGTIEFLELIRGEKATIVDGDGTAKEIDIATASSKELKQVWKDLDKNIKNTSYSVRDFFTVDEDGNSTSTGVYNFLKAIQELENTDTKSSVLGKTFKEIEGIEKLVEKKDGKIIGFDFDIVGGDEVIAEALGISEELVQIMLRAADDAGFVVNLDGTYKQYAELSNEAKAATNTLRELSKENDKLKEAGGDFEFDFDATSVKSLEEDLKQANKILDTFKDKKTGEIDLSAPGAVEAMQIVSTLQARLDDVTKEKYGIGLTVEEEKFEEPLENLQQYGRTIATLNQLEINPKANAEEIKQYKAELDEIAEYFANLDGDLKVELGFKADDGIEEVKKKIESGEVKIPTVLDIQANMDRNLEDLKKIALLGSGLLNPDQEEKLKLEILADIDVKPDEVKVDDTSVTKKVAEATNSSILYNGVINLSNIVGKYTDKEQEVVIKYLADTSEYDDFEAKDKEAVVKFIADSIDVDNYTAPEKEAYAKYIADGGNLDDYTPEEKTAIAKYLVDGGDVESYSAPDQDAIVKFLKNTVDIDNYTPAQKEAIAKFIRDSLDVDNYQMPTNKWAYAKYLKDTYDIDIWTPPLKTGGIAEYTPSIIDTTPPTLYGGTAWYNALIQGDSPVNGTANVNGTAFANGTTGRAFKQGDWGTKGSGVALMGELGRETIVRGGRFFTVGDNGAGFYRYKKGDVIFNHKQTEELFKYGKVTSDGGRARAYVSGTAFSNGTGGGIEPEKPSFTIGYDYSASSDSDSKKSQNIFDWIEVAIERIEREIDNLDKKANNVYKSWSSRNKALADEIDKVGNEIVLQQKAYDGYIHAANQVGLSSEWKKKVQSGAIDIDNVTDDVLKEKIDDYKKYYEQALACKDAILELQEAESSLYAQRFENIQTQYDGILQGYEHTEAMLNEYINQAEAKGHIVSRAYYDALVANEKSNIAELKKEQSALIAERDNAVADGKIVKGSEAWYEQCAAIDEVTQAIEEANTSIIGYNNSIRDIDFEIFELTQERISDIIAEADFLIGLMSNKKLFDDDGKLTSQGLSTMALHGQNYNTHMYQADEYGAKVAEIDRKIASGELDGNSDVIIDTRREYLECQRESILAAEDEKNAIRDLVEEGINLELDALQERIDLHNEELDSMKDLYGYQKRVEESSENIASLRKQLSAYEGFDDEETRAKVQELKVSLEKAEADLKETEYDKYISDQQALLDTLYNEYELILNTRLDNIDYLLESVVESINTAASADGTIATALGSEGAISIAVSNNATSIKDTLTSEAKNVGTTLSSAMNSIWNTGEGNAKSVLTMYGEDFRTKSTTIITTLNGIKSGVGTMVSSLNKEAEKKITANKTSTSAKKNPTASSSSSSKKATTTKSSSGDGKPKIGDKVTFVSGQYYYDSQGKKPLGSKYKGKQVYITNINTKDWATHGYHISTGNKLGKGDLGWLKLNQISGYAIGKQSFLDDEIAWTQENGKEFIVRPSDGAILTPIAKGDSILTSAASNNIWDMANSPAEFIKDNLGIGSAGVPSSANVNNNITQHFENITFSMPNVHGYNDLLREMQSDPKFEKLILSMTIDQIAGKSKLAKGKSIR